MKRKSATITQEAWLAELAAAMPRGRPAGLGWLTIREMATLARRDATVIIRWIQRHREEWESARGTIEKSNGVAQSTTFWRKKR